MVVFFIIAQERQLSVFFGTSTLPPDRGRSSNMADPAKWFRGADIQRPRYPIKDNRTLDGSEQDCIISSALAMELLQSHAEPEFQFHQKAMRTTKINKNIEWIKFRAQVRDFN